MYAYDLQEELGDVTKEGVGDVPNPICFHRLGVLTIVMLQHFRGEDVEVALPDIAQAQFLAHHSVGLQLIYLSAS